VTVAHHPRFDSDRATAILAGVDVAKIRQFRQELIETKLRIETQLRDAGFDVEAERADLIAEGVHPVEANWRARAAVDVDWKARAHAALRKTDEWLHKVKDRLHDLHADTQPEDRAAVCIAGAARDGRRAADAINHLLRAGCKIYGAIAIGGDLVVVASERPGGGNAGG
jgi:hypothetical protein